MTIVLLLEGETERVLVNKIREFLNEVADAESKQRPKLRSQQVDGLSQVRIGKQIKRNLETPDVSAVVALIDVYPAFKSALEAKTFLLEAAKSVGVEHAFHAHAAQHDVEAWILPFWDSICARIDVRQVSPGKNPEEVDHGKPPSVHLKELYQRAKHPRRNYKKPLEMSVILQSNDLRVAARVCPQLREFLNTLLALSDLSALL